MLLEVKHVVKYVGECLLFSMDSLSIYQGDRVVTQSILKNVMRTNGWEEGRVRLVLS